MQSLVSTEWLAGESGARDLRIADASWFLPDDHRDPRADHAAGHIPGAVFMDLAEIVDTATDLPTMLPSPEKFASRMAALGLGDGVRIILYDASPYHTAARAWVMLRSFGVVDVALLDGGLAKWRAEDRPIATGAETPKPRHITLHARGEGIRDREQMIANLGSGAAQVVDARSPARFAGDEPEPRPGTAAGHIPHARNLPQGRLFRPDGTWKQGAELAAAFTDAGIDLARPIVATCGSGITASVVAFGAHLLGRDAAVYDGSWAEWGSDPATPKAIGAA